MSTDTWWTIRQALVEYRDKDFSSATNDQIHAMTDALAADLESQLAEQQQPAPVSATEPACGIRRFTVYRKGDLSTTHNEQQVNPPDVPQFEGVVFSDGTCVLRWCTPLRSTSVWASLDDALGVHGHFEERYGTHIVWHEDDHTLRARLAEAERVTEEQVERNRVEIMDRDAFITFEEATAKARAALTAARGGG